MIDFSQPIWLALASKLLDERELKGTQRQYQPLLSWLTEQQFLQKPAPDHYLLTPLGADYLNKALTCAALTNVPVDLEVWLQEQNWQISGAVNEQVLAALYQQGDKPFTPIQWENFADKELTLYQDGQIRLRANEPFSLFFASGTLLDVTPWLNTLQEVTLAQRGLNELRKILWSQGELAQLITTDSVGAFCDLSLPPQSLLVWTDKAALSLLMPVVGALAPNVTWHHFSALEPTSVTRAQALAKQLGRPLSWWLPESFEVIMTRYAVPVDKDAPWQPSQLPKKLLNVCAPLIESERKLSAEVMTLAPRWCAVS